MTQDQFKNLCASIGLAVIFFILALALMLAAGIVIYTAVTAIAA